MEKQQTKTLINNTIMMYILSIAKLVIPLISLPYLTRVLSVDCYGSISFVKSIASYMQIIIDFGFLLSATKDIISLLKDKGDVNREVGNTLFAQLLLAVVSFFIMLIVCLVLDVLEGFRLFAILSLIAPILSIFLFEYVFKAYEQMGKIAVRFIVFKVIALILTLIFVKSDKDVLLMPIFDIFASAIAIVLVVCQLKKMGVCVDFSFIRIKEAFVSLKKSLIYFLSNFASTAFGVLNTVLIGLILSKSDVAYWTLTMQLLTAVHALYNPIINSVYPTMIKEKSLKLINKIMLIYTPLILVGCILVYFVSPYVVEFVFTEKYLMSATLFVYIIPVLIFSFPSMLYGWPCMGAINNERAQIVSTFIGVGVQLIGIVILIIVNQFTLINLALLRGVSEFVLCITRVGFVYYNKSKFMEVKKDVKS